MFLPPYIPESERLYRHLIKMGYTIDDDFLKPADLGYCFDTLDDPGANLFWQRSLAYFSEDSHHWAARLKETEELYVISQHYLGDDYCTSESDVHPDNLLIEPKLAYGKLAAIAWVLDMAAIRSFPITSVAVSPHHESDLVIGREDYPWMFLSPMYPEVSTGSGYRQAEKALRNLSQCDTPAYLSKRLSKIQRLSSITLTPGPFDGVPNTPGEPGSKEALMITCASVCTLMQSLAFEVVGKKVPRHHAQELSARHFGFHDWQTFRAAEKSRRLNVHPAYRLQFREYEDENSVLWGDIFCPNIASGISQFGAMIELMQCETYSLADGTFSPFELRSPGYADTRGYEHDDVVIDVWLGPMEMARPSAASLEKAADIIEGQDLPMGLISAFGSGGLNRGVDDLRKDIVTCHALTGVHEADHLFVDDWVLWTRNCDDGEGLFIGAMTLGAFGNPEGRDEVFEALLEYTSLNHSPDEGFFLQDDYPHDERSPPRIFYLDAIDGEGANLIRAIFFSDTKSETLH